MGFSSETSHYLTHPAALMINLRRHLLIVFLHELQIKATMSMAKSPDMILERSFVLELRPTAAEPKATAILLMGSPVSPDGKGLGAAATDEGLDAVFSFVMGLQSAEIFEGFGARMVDVVLAAERAAVAGKAEHSRRLDTAEGLRPAPVLRAVAPHVHLRGKCLREAIKRWR